MGDPVVLPELVFAVGWEALPASAQHAVAAVGIVWLVAVSTMLWLFLGWLALGAWWRLGIALVAASVAGLGGELGRLANDVREALGPDPLSGPAGLVLLGLPLAVVLAVRDRHARPLDQGRLAGSRARRRRAALTFG